MVYGWVGGIIEKKELLSIDHIINLSAFKCPIFILSQQVQYQKQVPSPLRSD